MFESLKAVIGLDVDFSKKEGLSTQQQAEIKRLQDATLFGKKVYSVDHLKVLADPKMSPEQIAKAGHMLISDITVARLKLIFRPEVSVKQLNAYYKSSLIDDRAFKRLARANLSADRIEWYLDNTKTSKKITDKIFDQNISINDLNQEIEKEKKMIKLYDKDNNEINESVGDLTTLQEMWSDEFEENTVEPENVSRIVDTATDIEYVWDAESEQIVSADQAKSQKQGNADGKVQATVRGNITVDEHHPFSGILSHGEYQVNIFDNETPVGVKSSATFIKEGEKYQKDVTPKFSIKQTPKLPNATAVLDMLKEGSHFLKETYKTKEGKPFESSNYACIAGVKPMVNNKTGETYPSSYDVDVKNVLPVKKKDGKHVGFKSKFVSGENYQEVMMFSNSAGFPTPYEACKILVACQTATERSKDPIRLKNGEDVFIAPNKEQPKTENTYIPKMPEGCKNFQEFKCGAISQKSIDFLENKQNQQGHQKAPKQEQGQAQGR